MLFVPLCCEACLALVTEANYGITGIVIYDPEDVRSSRWLLSNVRLVRALITVREGWGRGVRRCKLLFSAVLQR